MHVHEKEVACFGCTYSLQQLLSLHALLCEPHLVNDSALADLATKLEDTTARFGVCKLVAEPWACMQSLDRHRVVGCTCPPCRATCQDLLDWACS